MSLQQHNPVFVTGVQRSGSTIIAKLLNSTGAFFTGEVTKTMENIKLNAMLYLFYVNLQADPFGQYPLPVFEDIEVDTWDKMIINTLQYEGYDGKKLWLCKSSKIMQTLPLWYVNFPNAKYIIVRRRPSDIADSCMKTGYMTAFKNEKIRKSIGIADERECWIWWVNQQESALKEFLKNFKIDYRVIWPERMVDGNYDQFNEILKWLGLDWNNEIVELGNKLLWKSKYNERSKI